MEAIDAYRTYLSVKNHFTKKSYDYFKYAGKVKVTKDSFEKRKDKLFFQKMAKRDKELVPFIVSNIIKNTKIWSRDLAYSEDAEKVFQDWKRKQESFSYIFKDELYSLDEDFKENFIVKQGNHPILLKKYFSGKVSLETLCVLLQITGAKKYWDKTLQYDILWEDLSFLVEKYSPFLTYEKVKIKAAIAEIFDFEQYK